MLDLGICLRKAFPMLPGEIFFWKKAPFARLLFSLVTGIILQWYGQLSTATWYIVLVAGIVATTSFHGLALFTRYRLGFLNGFFILLPFTALGALLAWQHDIRHSTDWIGNQEHSNMTFAAVLDESPVEKTKSFKATATITHYINNKKATPVKGRVILYFRNDSMLTELSRGSGILFKKPLQEIKNSGNPGAFDYKRYSLFHGITHQAYLKAGEFKVLVGNDKQWLGSFLGKIREKVLTILRTNIKGEKELGLAEALLIGYKNDLDKTLVQSYTNTGVVHIIAISGLHLGLIYWLLVQLLKPLQRRSYARWLRPIIIICGLWLFSLLAGAQPSILRSAVMFTCIVLGENITKRTSIYNTLALSAFLLLCHNPYWLWDVGFQLSYAAVLSIIIFMDPVYNLFYIKNKLFDLLWKLNAVTIAAQVLTLPLSLYHFHQFPTLFILTNMVAVPLSSVILLKIIFLCIISFFSPVALLSGKMIGWLIGLMNGYIEKIEAISFSLLDGLHVNIAQVIFLYIFIAGISYWLLEKIKAGFITAMLALSAFFVLRSISFWQADQQQKIIVYNVPKLQAMDFINARQFSFTGDSELVINDFTRNFHLKTSRIMHRTAPAPSQGHLLKHENYISFARKNILVADRSVSYRQPQVKPQVDLLVISKNPKIYISSLHQSFVLKQVVFDGSTPAWKLKFWKKDCDSLHIPYHDVSEKGAFVMNLN